jgi:hypothetical protein
MLHLREVFHGVCTCWESGWGCNGETRNLVPNIGIQIWAGQRFPPPSAFTPTAVAAVAGIGLIPIESQKDPGLGPDSWATMTFPTLSRARHPTDCFCQCLPAPPSAPPTNVLLTKTRHLIEARIDCARSCLDRDEYDPALMMPSLGHAPRSESGQRRATGAILKAVLGPDLVTAGARSTPSWPGPDNGGHCSKGKYFGRSRHI